MKRHSWYILLIKNGFEQSVKDQLLSRKDELEIQDVLISDDFSGYVFIRSIEISQSLVSLFLELEGVSRFLGIKQNSRKPQRFTRTEIDRLKIKPQKRNIFHIGDNVIVRKGDLSDIQGEIIEIGKRIVKIKPPMLCKIVRVSIHDIEFS